MPFNFMLLLLAEFRPAGLDEMQWRDMQLLGFLTIHQLF
jgi:hypothetical protein